MLAAGVYHFNPLSPKNTKKYAGLEKQALYQADIVRLGAIETHMYKDMQQIITKETARTRRLNANRGPRENASTQPDSLAAGIQVEAIKQAVQP